MAPAASFPILCLLKLESEADVVADNLGGAACHCESTGRMSEGGVSLYPDAPAVDIPIARSPLRLRAYHPACGSPPVIDDVSLSHTQTPIPAGTRTQLPLPVYPPVSRSTMSSIPRQLLPSMPFSPLQPKWLDETTYTPSSLLTPPGLTSHSPFPPSQDTHPALPSSSFKRIQSRRCLPPFVSA
ncbi:hypothetical protein R3P38DRAFT_3168470 [Favolaschia claudopus]|uniref:Uncharacterized protein n=1 Tax=Favolaschia claudopus TaxID=2862362 RepID=A0AAW0E634_9AGAR